MSRLAILSEFIAVGIIDAAGNHRRHSTVSSQRKKNSVARRSKRNAPAPYSRTHFGAIADSFTIDGRGRGLAADIRWHSIADRQIAGTARTSITERSRQMRQRQGQRCALIQPKKPTQRLDAANLLVYCNRTRGNRHSLCYRRSAKPSWPPIHRRSGECQFTAAHC